MTKKLSFILFLLVLFLGSFFRLYKLDSYPVSLFSDEVDAGYQAKVFLNQETDYFNHSWPIHFQSFADWRTPLMIYSIALSFKLFGISALTLRLPVAIFGILSLPALYFLVKRLTKNKYLAFFGLALLAFSPWHIHYSRVAFELSLMLFFLILGLERLTFYAQTKKSRYFFHSLFFLLLSTYSYSTAKLFVFLILLSFFLVYKVKLIKPLLTRKSILPLALLFLLAFPMIFSTLKGESGYRFSYINIFTDPTTAQDIDRQREMVAVRVLGAKTVGLETPLLAKIYHNKIFSWTQIFLKNYLSSFSTEFLFLKGDLNLRHSFGSLGLLLYPELILILLGLVKLLSSRPSKEQIFFLFLLLLSPIPFSLTRDAPGPHASRLLVMLPFLIILEVYGLLYLFTYLKKKTLIFVGLFLSLLIFWSLFWHHYFYQYPYLSERVFHSGLKEAVLSSLKKQDEYQKIYFSDKQEPFLPFFLFWGPYQKDLKNLPITSSEDKDFSGQNIDKFFFGRLNLGFATDHPEIFFQPGSLYVLGQYDLPLELIKDNSHLKIVDEIKLPFSQETIYYLLAAH
jgi:4-amino-4-deoxy-L-arabinose transferase-like glycosyltransferase